MMIKSFRSKKGVIGIPLNVLITLILSSVVFVGVLSIVNVSDASESYEKQLLATDTALLIDTMYASKGNLFVIYPQEQNFRFQFKRNNVVVSGGEKKGERTQFFIEDSGSGFADNLIDFNDQDVNFMIFVKQGKNFYVSKSGEKRNRNTNFMECTSSEPLNAVVLDPIDDSAIRVTSLLAATLGSEITEKGQTLKERKALIGTNPFISIKQGEKNRIKAYIKYDSSNKEKSVALSCNIINSLLEEFPETTGTAIIPYYKQDDENLKILELDNLGLVLSIPQGADPEKVRRAVENVIKKK